MQTITTLTFIIISSVVINLAKNPCSAQDLITTNSTLARRSEAFASNMDNLTLGIGDHQNDNCCATNNATSKYIFGIPPIPLDPIIPEASVDDDFETWVPPTEIKKYYPALLSGFDLENRPIWIYPQVRLTKSDVRKIAMNKNPALRQQRRKLLRRNAYLAVKSLGIKSTKEKPVTQYISIVDCENFSSDVLTSPLIVWTFLRHFRKYRNFYDKYVYKNIYVNVNFISEIWLNLIRKSVLGRLLNRLEIYGTNKPYWIQELLKQFPRDQLPEKYGGLKGHELISLSPN